MLLIGYLFGIKSERRLEQEINLNLAYRWFCRLDLHKNVPDHSTFSQNKELESMPGFIRPNPETEKKTVVKSKTDPDCGYFDQSRKSGLGYTAGFLHDYVAAVEHRESPALNT